MFLAQRLGNKNSFFGLLVSQLSSISYNIIIDHCMRHYPYWLWHPHKMQRPTLHSAIQFSKNAELYYIAVVKKLKMGIF